VPSLGVSARRSTSSLDAEMKRPVVLFLQAIAVMAVGVALSMILYSAWFQTCCMDALRLPIGLLTIPAGFVAMILGGGVHSATAADFTFGLVVELLIFWGIYHFFRTIKLKRQG
jgi:hypothetical protein